MAISYDSPDTLKKFADSRGITFPLLSDAGSAIIKRYGLLNEQQDPKTRFYGVPHPGTFILDRERLVVARFFEDAYQERYTAAAILAARGVDPGRRRRHGQHAASVAEREHQRYRAGCAGRAPDHRRGGDAAARGCTSTPQASTTTRSCGSTSIRSRGSGCTRPGIRRRRSTTSSRSTSASRSTAQPFRLTRDVTLLATPEAQKQLGAMPAVTITGALEYQACDDAICFNPATGAGFVHAVVEAAGSTSLGITRMGGSADYADYTDDFGHLTTEAITPADCDQRNQVDPLIRAICGSTPRAIPFTSA